MILPTEENADSGNIKYYKENLLPVKLAKAVALAFEGIAKITKTRPLFTKYSLHTMDGNGRFSHDKATMELGYCPRDIKDTITDTIKYLKTKKCSAY